MQVAKKHKLHDSRVQMFFKPATVKQISTSVGRSQSCSTQSSSNQSSNDKETIAKQLNQDLVVRKSKTGKEIIWTLKCVASGYSHNSCRDLQKIFSAMLTDSNITKSITVGADKMRYVVNFGIAPVLKSILIDSVRKAEVFVALFDEGLNHQTQNSEMDILIRYFDDIEKMVIKTVI